MNKMVNLWLLASIVGLGGCADISTEPVNREASKDTLDQKSEAALTTSDLSKPIDSEPLVGIKSMTGTVLATVKLETDHVLYFTEFAPGITGVVEVTKPEHKMVVTPAVRSLDIVAQYRRFAGASATVPQKLVRANELRHRRDADLKANPEKPGGLPPDELGAATGMGPHFYTQDELNWFGQAYCNGATACPLGWDWAQDYSGWHNTWVPSWTQAYGMVGSEAPAYGSLTASEYRCLSCCEWYCIGSANWGWAIIWSGLILPGYVVGASGNVVHHIHWITDTDPSTTAALAAWYNW